jgi:flagellar FliL protein
MSAAAAELPEGVPVVKSGKKKLILIGVIVLVVLALVGGGVTWWLKKRAAHAAQLAEEESGGKAVVEHKVDMSHPPTFLPLEPFVVNLADRDVDRYAQIGITLELESPAFAEQMKGFMPAVRNAILMVIAHKSARELLDRSGKEDLAAEIMREAGRPMGIEIDPPLRLADVAVAVAKVEAAAPTPIPIAIPPLAAASSASAPAAATAQASAPEAAASSALAAASAPASAAVLVATASPAPHGAKPKVLGDGATGPIRHVHFSSFIIQ